MSSPIVVMNRVQRGDILKSYKSNDDNHWMHLIRPYRVVRIESNGNGSGIIIRAMSIFTQPRIFGDSGIRTQTRIFGDSGIQYEFIIANDDEKKELMEFRFN